MGCYYGVWAYTRYGVGEFWPEDIDVELCDVIYYGFGNVLNDTYEVCSWDPWFDLDPEIDGADGSIKNCIQERDGDAWPPGCVTDGNMMIITITKFLAKLIFVLKRWARILPV